MCGRYALGLRAAFIRHQLQQDGLEVDDAPDDDAVRETYNFAPGYYGLVYRADVPDYGAGGRPHDRSNNDTSTEVETEAPEQEHDQEADTTTQTTNNAAGANPSTQEPTTQEPKAKPTKYILQPMKWGLIPFWTKRSPDYSSMLRTINCRDDSLLENRGMWTTMKNRKRCIVIAQGFYEWLKKGPGGKEKVPHFVKRKDGKLMCWAGLWDCVRYEGVDDEGREREKLYSYTVITTDSNAQLKFLHDRMPVILEQGSEGMRTWLDPGRSTWSKELQSLLKPFKGELECYPVSKDVGKVGNNSPDFLIPVDSKENKKNIANFFANARGKKEGAVKGAVKDGEVRGGDDKDEKRVTNDMDDERTEDNAPMPAPPETEKEVDSEDTTNKRGTKRLHTPDPETQDEKSAKAAKTSPASSVQPKKEPTSSPEKLKTPAKTAVGGRKTRSAVSNETKGKGKGSPVKKTAGDGSQRITNFFVK